MTDDSTDGRVIEFPAGGEPGYVPPPIPLYRDTAPTREPEIPSESPEETTLELPPIPAMPAPESYLTSREFPTISYRAESGGDEEIEEGEYEGDGDYVERRSLADAIGDWLAHRIAIRESLHEAEAPYREARIADKVTRLQAQTSRETGLLEQRGLLRQALVKAQAARAAAQGRSDAAGMAGGSGTRRTSPWSAGGRGSGSGAGGGSNSGAGSRGSTGSPRRGGGSQGAQNASGGAPGGRGSAGRGTESRGGSPGRHSGAGGRGTGGGGSRGAGGSFFDRPGARARQERRSSRQAAGLADRTSARDQARGRRQTAWEDRHADRRGRAAARRDRTEARRGRRDAEREARRVEKRAQEEADRAAKGAEGRVTLGTALANEAERRWRDRREQRDTAAVADKVDLTKKPQDAADASAPAVGDPGSTKAQTEAAATGPQDKVADAAPDTPASSTSGGSTGVSGKHDAESREPKDSRNDKAGSRAQESEAADGDVVDAELVPRRQGHREAADADTAEIPDAEIVESEIPPHRPASASSSPPGAAGPRREDTSMAGQKMAAQHRTEITLDEYLIGMTNIAVTAERDKETAEELAEALGTVADALREMSADLVGDHNIATEVTNLIANLADSAEAMKKQAQHCATECEEAAACAAIAARAVAQTYCEDMNAMDQAGLSQASAAAHHD